MNNIIIKPESISFSELVKTNTLSLSINAQSDMIDMLNSEFNQEQVKRYILNLYMFLYFHPITDFPVNLEDIYKDLGFANKGNAMKTIKNNFTKDEDYKTVLFPREKNLGSKDLGGRPEEQIMLNIDTYKMLCMLVKTPQGKEIRKYYVKLENIYNSIIKKEIDNTKVLLEENKQELEYTKKELQKMSVCTIKKWHNVEPGDTVYAFKNIGEKYIKIGKAENIKKREDGYTVGNRTSDIFYFKKCHSCKLTEKVLHHVLDKYRLQSNREWFDISDELAIYTIDMVCNFLDSFIGCSEELINLKVNEQLFTCIEQANIIKKNIEEKKNKQIEEKAIEIKIRPIKIKPQEDTLKEHFDKFVKEYCIVGNKNKCLTSYVLGAYRMWNKKTTSDTKKNLSVYMKNNFKTKQEYLSEYETKLTYYIGVDVKDFIIKQDDDNILPHYEEFILSECKFDYTYRTTKAILFNNFNDWVAEKYPNYIFSKNEKIHYESYLNRKFLNCKKIPINGGTNGYYGVQMKSDPTEVRGIAMLKRKKVYKIDCVTKEIMETYDSLFQTAIKIDIDERKLSGFVLNNAIIDDKYYYSYSNDI